MRKGICQSDGKWMLCVHPGRCPLVIPEGKEKSTGAGAKKARERKQVLQTRGPVYIAAPGAVDRSVDLPL